MQGIDLVNDNPENALLREVDQIRESQKIMKTTLETVNHQIATNLNTRHKLKRDFDKAFGAPWNVIVGECYSFDIDYDFHFIYYFLYGPVAILAWRVSFLYFK